MSSVKYIYSVNFFFEYAKSLEEKGVKVENDEAILISKKTYEDLVIWVEEKLKSTTLFDLAWKDEFEILTYVTVYQNLKREKIDFDTEFVLFIHDW